MRSLILVAALAAPTFAAAACEGTPILSCPIMGTEKQLDVCAAATGFTYSFGPPGAPELTLSVPYADRTVTPWPGVGNSIWSSLRFPAGGYAYDIYLSVERTGEDVPPEGLLLVMTMPDETVVAEFACGPGPWFGDVFAFQDAMADAGYCRDLDAQFWRADACP